MTGNNIFRFIGQIPRNCPEYNTCNTSKSMGLRREKRKSMVNSISGKNQSQGQNTSSFFSPTEESESFNYSGEEAGRLFCTGKAMQRTGFTSAKEPTYW